MKGQGQKKRAKGILLAGLFVVGMAYAQTDFPDIPKGHWAYEAVQKLYEAGVLQGFPDGTFRGDEYTTRYQLALALYRLIENNPQVISSQDIFKTIEFLVSNLRDELNQIASKVENLNLENKSNRLDELEKEIEAYKTYYSGLVFSLESELSLLKAQVQNEGEIKDQAIAKLLAEYASLKEQLDFLFSGQLPAPLTKKIVDTVAEKYDRTVDTLMGRIRALEQDVASLKTEVARIDSEQSSSTTQLREQIKATAESIKEDTAKRLEDLKNSTPEIYASGRVEGVYDSTPLPKGTFAVFSLNTYTPSSKTGYEVISGFAPSGVLIGGGVYSGNEEQGIAIRGIGATGGEFGLGIGGWGRGEGALVFRGEAAYRTSNMPPVVFPEYRGGTLSLSGNISGLLYNLDLGGGWVMGGGRAPFSIASVVDGCERLAYRGSLGVTIPFLNFALRANGSLGSDTPASQGSCVPGISYNAYEVGVAHDPQQENAIVPGLDVYIFLAGIGGQYGTALFDQRTYGVRTAYANSLGFFGFGFGGSYYLIDVTQPAGANPGVQMAVYPGSGQLVDLNALFKFSIGNSLKIQMEGSYGFADLSNGRRVNLSATPGVIYSWDGGELKVYYLYERGLGWDRSEIQAIGAYGLVNRSRIGGFFKNNALNLSAEGYYDLNTQDIRFSVKYNYSW